MIIKPREYQLRAQALADAAFMRGVKSLVVAMPTGSGKTFTFCDWMVNKIKSGMFKRALIVAHRKELIDQFVKTFREKVGYHDFSVVMGVPKDDARTESPVVLCSIQKIMRSASVLNAPDLVVIDECHMAPSPRYLESIMRWQGQAHFLGLSATPDRDGLGKIFKEIVHPVMYSELVEAGVLVPLELVGATERTRVEWDDADNPEWLPLVRFKEYCVREDGTFRKTLVFNNTREQNAIMKRVLETTKARVEEFHGELLKKKREALLEAHKAGEIDVLVDAGCLNTGYDDTSLEAIMLMMPCLKSITYVQAANRCTRSHVYPDGRRKTKAYLLDMCGAYTDHGSPDIDQWFGLQREGSNMPCPQCGADLKRDQWLLKRVDGCKACEGKTGIYRHCPEPTCGWHYELPERGKGEGLSAKEKAEFPVAMVELIDRIASRVPGMARTERGMQHAQADPLQVDKFVEWQKKNWERDGGDHDHVIKKATYYAMISFRRRLNAQRAKRGQRPYNFGWTAKLYKGWYGKYPERKWTDFLRQPDERLTVCSTLIA